MSTGEGVEKKRIKEWTLGPVQGRVSRRRSGLARRDVRPYCGRGEVPPLLGTGGNDGRLEFSNNFMQNVVSRAEHRTSGAMGLRCLGTVSWRRCLTRVLRNS